MLRRRKMSMFEGTRIVVVVLILVWFGSPTNAQNNTTESACVTRLVQGDCAEKKVITRADALLCCSAVKREIRNDQDCMCEEFKANLTATDIIFTNCNITFNIAANCRDVTPPTSSNPVSNYTPVDYSTSPSDSGTSGIIIIAIIVPIVIIVVLIIVIVIICICKKKPQVKLSDVSNIQQHNAYVEVEKDHLRQSHQGVPTDVPRYSASSATNKDDFMTSESLQYELATLQAATNNFSDDNVIGRGGFGSVYKGTLSNGQEIAVKRLSHTSGQGDKEFKSEIELLAKLQHRNMVRLLGYGLAEKEALLVYELVPNRSLDYFLFDSLKREELTWPIRFEIIRGIARGILYLHEDAPQRTIHRDLKAANVLLDAKMNPKIADFGLARICSHEQTHVEATRVVGTKGYMSPEYLLYGQFSVKSDIYAFGALVLEIVSGTRIGNGPKVQPGERNENLMTYAWRCWGEEKPLELIDPMLKDSFSSDEVVKCVHLGLLCLQDDVNQRPPMSAIVHMLNSYSGVAIASLPTPQFPGLLYSSGSYQTTTSTTTTQTVHSSSGGGGVNTSTAFPVFKESR